MASPAWMRRLERTLGRVALWCFRRHFLALILVAVASLAGLWCARGLSLKADLSELLPRSSSTVRELEAMRAKVGGVGYVVVALQGGSLPQLKACVDALTPKLATLEGIRFAEPRRASEFFKKQGLYYLSLDDLRELDGQIREREAYEYRKRNPLFVDLSEDEPPPALDASKLQALATDTAAQRLAGNGEGYLIDPTDKLAIILLKPAGSSTNLDYARQTITRVEDFLERQDLKRFGADITYSLTGTFKKKLDQQAQLMRDLALTSTVAGILMVLVLLWHFRGVMALVSIFVPVGVGLAITYGFTAVAFGSVNLLTAFLGAVLGGLGTEHGIHLHSGFAARRAESESPEHAVRETFEHTGASSLVSSVVAALTFFSLSFSDFRAFREFGLIAAVGMVVGVLGYFATLPALLGLATRLGWRPQAEHVISGRDSFLSTGLARHARAIRLASLPLLLLLTALVPFARFNYDFGTLEDNDLKSYQLDRRVNALLGYSQTPTLILAESPAEERAWARAVNERKKSLGAGSTVDFVATASMLLPDNQTEKSRILAALHRRLNKIDPESLAPNMREKFQSFLAMTEARPFTWADLPQSLRNNFESATGEPLRFVMVYPKVRMSDGLAVQAFAHELRTLPPIEGQQARVAGDSMILSEIIDLVMRESAPVLLGAITAVLLALWITEGTLAGALLCLSPTLVSVIGLAGLMVLGGIRFDFLNVVAIPVLVGTTVDAAVHLRRRLRASPPEEFGEILAHTGRAICGGLITSAIGFAALAFASHPGLRSLGRLTILGFSFNLLVTLILFPTVLLRIQERKHAKTTGKLAA